VKEAFRDMGHICVINQRGIDHFAKKKKKDKPAATSPEDAPAAAATPLPAGSTDGPSS
jgi:hypothetical protein